MKSRFLSHRGISHWFTLTPVSQTLYSYVPASLSIANSLLRFCSPCKTPAISPKRTSWCWLIYSTSVPVPIFKFTSILFGSEVPCSKDYLFIYTQSGRDVSFLTFVIKLIHFSLRCSDKEVMEPTLTRNIFLYSWLLSGPDSRLWDCFFFFKLLSSSLNAAHSHDTLHPKRICSIYAEACLFCQYISETVLLISTELIFNKTRSKTVCEKIFHRNFAARYLQFSGNLILMLGNSKKKKKRQIKC